jgi:hypothetical protein
MTKIRNQRGHDYSEWLRGDKLSKRVNPRSWVRRPDGDWRVICTTTGKIYLGPDSASLDLKLFYMDIVNVCEKWLKKCGSDMEFEWYSSYLKNTENPIIPSIPQVIVVKKLKVEEWSQRKYLRDSGITKLEWSSRVYTISCLIKELMDENKIGVDLWIPVDYLNLVVGNKYKEHEEYNDEPWTMDNKSLSKHIASHSMKYERLFNAQFRKVYNSKKSCWQLQCKFFYPTVELTREEVIKYDDEASYRVRSLIYTGFPVICLNNGRIFDSVEAAGRITGVPPRWVKWSCYGDVEFVHPRIISDLDFLYFRFVEYE